MKNAFMAMFLALIIFFFSGDSFLIAMPILLVGVIVGCTSVIMGELTEIKKEITDIKATLPEKEQENKNF
ncbi:MAG: hypothetical protein VB120_04035 [Lachnospiraceae bacterium]|nr:hypothetical protein [Lachnospiraceae bacterium]